MTFRVGMKVVCVDDSATDIAGGRELTRGAIYTIRWIGVWGAYNFPDAVCVRLEEVWRTPDEFQPEVVDMPWRPSRFRPVVERETDISTFTKMLTPQGVDA